MISLLGAISTVAMAGTAAAQAPATAPQTDQGSTYNARMLGATGTGVITVRLDGKRTTVRLLGVGDAGTGNNERSGCLRETARSAVLGLLPLRKSVTLVTQARERDSRGRVLAWVYPGGGSGKASVNWKLVQRGQAPAKVAGGMRWATELRHAEQVARKKRLGRWGNSCSLSTVAGIQRRLVSLGYLPNGSDNNSLDYRTQQAVMAFQGWVGLTRTGLVDDTTRKRLSTASRPVPWNRSASGRRLEVHIDRQVLLLIENGVTQRAIHVSSGAGGRTPRGRFSVIRREIRSWSNPFSVTLPYAQYFYGGFAFHEYPSVPGYPASHGCVRLPAPEAPVVWNFSSYGTPVTVG